MPDKHKSLVCGSGGGAARVIEDTLSPSRRFALAWRTPNGSPDDQPDSDKIELVLVRIADGAILTTAVTEFWATGEMRVNRLEERAAWSPNSRFVVREFHTRFETGNVDLYAIGKDGGAAGALDLRKIMDPAIRARLQQRVRDAADYTFSVLDQPKPKIGNDGLMRARVMMWIPKEGPHYYYAVTLQVTEKTGAGLSARMISIMPRN